jgi:SAM-dependent methyltransferase
VPRIITATKPLAATPIAEHQPGSQASAWLPFLSFPRMYADRYAGARSANRFIVNIKVTGVPDFSVVAIIAAHNEADIIGQVVADLIHQGVLVYFLDDGSTDGTVGAVEPFLGRGVIRIEQLNETFQRVEPAGYEWERILQRKSQLASELDANWFIHHDADEFRESPWLGTSLKDAIRYVDAAGFNAIDFAVFDFWPTHDHFTPENDIRESFTFYAPSEHYNRIQVRCWRKNREVDLASSGGHEAQFEERRIFPVPFILRHYAIRGQQHGERKVFRERLTRFLSGERARGWHIQYDKLPEGASFIRDPQSLTPYDPIAARVDLMLRHRSVDECHNLARDLECRNEALSSAHEELDRRAQEVERLRQDATIQKAHAIELAHALQESANQNENLRRNVDARATENDNLRSVLDERSRQLDELYQSKSWRVTAPLRAMYGLALGNSESNPRPLDASGARTRVKWGDLARLSPFSEVWGTDRGLPIDRHYIHQFLERHRSDIRGRVLEVKDPHYAKMFGGAQVLETEILDVDPANPQATLITDLTSEDQLPASQFDCFILTQTIHIVYDIKTAVSHARQVLKPGGVLLCTVPAVSRINYENGGLEAGDFWRLTRAAILRLFGDVFGNDNVTVETYGNVRVCAAFLYGLAAEELSSEDLSLDDQWFPLVHCIRAVRAEVAIQKTHEPFRRD